MLVDERTTHNNALTLPTQVEALVVAPSRTAARPMLTFLKQQGISVRTSDDANSAFEEALMYPPDVVIIDERIGTPGPIELCQQLKGNVRTHFVPTILLALNDVRPFRLKALAAGADAIFSAATDPQERRTRLWALLRTRSLYRRLDRKQREQGSEIVERRRWLAYLLHDLQGSMAALRANVDFMSRFGPAESDPKRVDFEESVEDARMVFDQLMHSVRTVIDFDRAESGQLPLAIVPTRVGDLVRQIAEELGRNPIAAVTVSLEAPRDERPMPIDPDLIRRVLFNLVTHCARRFQGAIAVRLSHFDGGLRVWVAGQGTGPTPAEKTSMFEPFAQLGEKPVGYGLGLALARVVLELHGGRIWWEDVPGGGGAFALTLASEPVRRDPPPLAPTSAPPSTADSRS
jgi:signal transduction histidine kinase